MKVRTVITSEIDLAEIYELCRPIEKKKCAAAIRKFVDFHVQMLADPDGGWRYPSANVIAAHLIENGLATLAA